MQNSEVLIFQTYLKNSGKNFSFFKNQQLQNYLECISSLYAFGLIFSKHLFFFQCQNVEHKRTILDLQVAMHFAFIGIFFGLIYTCWGAGSDFTFIIKREVSSKCLKKFPKVQNCHDLQFEINKNLVKLIEEGREKEAIERYAKEHAKYSSCRRKIQKFEKCCSKEQDCSLLEEEYEKLVNKIKPLNSQMKKLTGKSFYQYFIKNHKSS